MTDRFYEKKYVSRFDAMINWLNRSNKHKFHFMFINTHKIIDSEGKIPDHVVCDYYGYNLEKFNTWDQSIKENKRFFICHNDNGHFQIIDCKYSDPYTNTWKGYTIPKKDTAKELCNLLNSLC